MSLFETMCQGSWLSTKLYPNNPKKVSFNLSGNLNEFFRFRKGKEIKRGEVNGGKEIETSLQCCTTTARMGVNTAWFCQLVRRGPGFVRILSVFLLSIDERSHFEITLSSNSLCMMCSSLTQQPEFPNSIYT